MFLRPKRTRTGMAFLGGLSISVVLLAGGYMLYRSEEARLTQQLEVQAKASAQAAWEADHPMEPVYVFSRDLRMGDVLTEEDLVLRELPMAALPEDAITDPVSVRGMVVRGEVLANTLCMQSLLYQPEEYPDDARIQEFTSIRLPSRLEENQYVDVRATFPNGLDYVVLSKKAVRSLELGETGTGQRIWLTVNEEEILRISSAIVDAYLHPGTVLYALTYVAPDIQAAAICTYPANSYVQDLICSNPNILVHAVTELDRANRAWFDAIPDPQPSQPLASVPAPEPSGDMQGAEVESTGQADVAEAAGTDSDAAGPSDSAAPPPVHDQEKLPQSKDGQPDVNEGL